MKKNIGKTVEIIKTKKTISYIFFHFFVTREKSMFVRFFVLSTILRNTDLFSAVSLQIQLNFFLLSYFFELYNYRK